MLEFLKESTGRRIAVFRSGDRLRLLQGFTSDTDLLVQAVNQTGASSLMGYQAELTGYPTDQPASPGPAPSESSPAAGSGHQSDMAAWEKLSAKIGRAHV